MENTFEILVPMDYLILEDVNDNVQVSSLIDLISQKVSQHLLSSSSNFMFRESEGTGKMSPELSTSGHFILSKLLKFFKKKKNFLKI